MAEYRSHRAERKPRKVFNLRNLTSLGIVMVVVSGAFLVGNAMAASTSSSSTCVGTTLGPNGELDLHCVVPLPPATTVTVPGPTVTVTVPVPTTTTVTVTPSPTTPPPTTVPPTTTPPPTTPPPTTPPPGGCVAGAQFTPQCYWAKFVNGPPASNTYFPIGVWLQDPLRTRNGQNNALNYKAAGVNTFVALWDFPARSDSQARVQAIRNAGLQVWAGGEDGDTAGANTAKGYGVTGYMLGDEWDMNKAGDCGTSCSSTAVAGYGAAVRAKDPTRPIYGNFGKPVSLYPWAGYHCDNGSITCSAMQTELQRYCSALDIASSDYYAATDHWEDSGSPRDYGLAVDHTRAMCGNGTKPVLGFVETGHPDPLGINRPGISANCTLTSWDGSTLNTPGCITPDGVEWAVWSQLAHGANGIIYFSHDFADCCGLMAEDGMLTHPAVLARITAINAQIKTLAPILNAARLTSGLSLGAGVDATYRAGGYIVAAESTGTGGSRSFTVTGAAGHTITVVGEGRSLVANASGTFTDTFTGWGHHVYQVN